MKSKMLGALALLTLIGALFVMQSAEQHTPTVDAATVSIDALNVGTCLTTNDDVFKGDCDNLMNDAAGTENDWEVRAKKTEVKTLYATYAHDPKTQSEAPRAILMDSDLIKISISDSGRDKRTGVLIGSGNNALVASASPYTPTALGKAIKDDLDGDKLNYPTKTNAEIAYTNTAFDFTTNESTDDNAIPNSGTHTLNFTRSSGSTADFLPGDFDVDNGAEVRFYGCVANTGATTCTNETYEVLDELKVDEDASNGNAAGDTAPWLGINASVPNEKDVLIFAIYYRTSDKENLVGGERYRHCGSGNPNPQEVNKVWTCASGTLGMNDGDSNVVFTKDEKDDNDALLVSARGDGDLVNRHVNLYLKETKRFSGVYQGHIRLTDANGDGQDANATPTDTTITDWGREVTDGTSNTADGAAVLAIDQGPVIIEYRDSDGKKQTLNIEIDNVAPTITVTSPANGSSSDDQSPDFIGTLEDADSGLADKSFRLVVDNEVDDKDGVEGKQDDFVLNDQVSELNVTDNTDTTKNVTGSGAKGEVTRIADYRGYDSTTTGPSQFGIVSAASDLYDLGDDSCDNRNLCHILADEYDDGANRGTFDDDLRLDLQDGGKDAVTQDNEFDVDFQAFVMDMAGNIGFSDSDPANPRYINDLGEKDAKKRKPGNVLGYYSAHVIKLDEKDPDIIEAKSATGYYGLDSDDEPIHDRYGIMVEFDGPVAPSSVSTNTFSVTLDNGSAASVVDVDVKKKYVFLKLGSELASDATPKIDIAQSQKVEDMAGNETFGKEQDEFEAKDGISPKLTITLSGGSGGGSGKEGPDKLTKDQITINVSSDEEMQGAPKVVVVCSSLRWNEGDASAIEGSSDLTGQDIDDYVDNRSGAFVGDPEDERKVETKPKGTKSDATGKTFEYTCGYDENDDKFDDDFVIGTPSSALARPGENWDYTWKKPSGTPGHGSQAFKDGSLTVVVFGHDRSRYDHVDKTNVQNWGSASAEFTLDTDLKDPTQDGGGDLQPKDGGTSKEDRPFILIEFNENTTVKLDSVELDDVEVASKFERPQTNRFVYWPESLSKGKHEVEVEATDAAGNEQSFEFSFTVEARAKFLIELQAGWNAVSVPADPIDTAISSVFSDPAIETVIGWDTQGWRIAVRRDGAWESNHQYGALNEIRSKYGYWVKSSKFIDQPVALKGSISRSLSGAPSVIGIDTNPGWNFVGVVDQQGIQTEDHFGKTLKDSQDNPLTASEYLNPNYVRAYTWDPTFGRFEVLRDKDTMTIGKGVWVYYPETGGIAP